jgi:hypothetical protein
MKSKFVLLFLFIMFLTGQLIAQNNGQYAPKYDQISLGLGLGQVFGGIGGNLLVYPQQNVGIFGGAGYALVGFGYNVGVKVRFVSPKTEHIIRPYATGMYGYNFALLSLDDSKLNKVFYGPTVGFGVDYKSNPAKKSYWTTAILLPFRSSEVNDYIDQNNLEVTQLPFSISFGYHIILN